MKKLWIVILSGWLVTLGAGIVQAQSGYDLFQKALAKERAEGNIPEAIQLYQRIVKEHAVNRTLAAKALVAMGQCYEKLGKAEARRAYERVVKEFADQAEQASEARTRLAALSPPPNRTNGSTMAARRVWAGREVDALGAPSPDGHHLTYVHWETGDLAVRDLVTGQNRRLTNKGSWFESTEFALFSIVSPDGRQVAYNWYNKENFAELRLLPLDGTTDNAKPRILYRNEETEYIQPSDWSADGKQILSLLTKRDGTNQIVLVASADGSIRALKTLDWRYPQKMAFSPDGRYIVYDFPTKETAPERDIFLLAADGSREIALVQHPANDLYPQWSPDGTRVVFASDRTGSMGLWAIPVNNGKAQGNPELIKPDIGRAYPMGFTRKGFLYYGLRAGIQDIYIAELDLAAGKLASPPVAASHRYVGSNTAPAWSPDGEYLAYVSQRSPVRQGPGSTVIVIRSLKTGEERELSLNMLNRFQRPRWSPDGRSFLAVGQNNKGRQGIYRVEVGTGEVTPVVQVETGVYVQQSAPSGNALFYLLSDRKFNRVLSRDLETNKETEIYRVTAPHVNGLAVSPDGRRLAFVLADPATRSGALMLIPASGGEPRELLRLKEPESILYASLEWTPDGRELLFAKAEDVSGEKIPSLWRISTEGGQAQKVDLAMWSLRNISFHPDGRRIVFQAGESKQEVWVMENFLPALRAAK